MKQMENDLSEIRRKVDQFQTDMEAHAEDVVEKMNNLEEDVEELRDAMEKIVGKCMKTKSAYVQDLLDTNTLLGGKLRALEDTVEELSNSVVLCFPKNSSSSSQGTNAPAADDTMRRRIE